MTGTGSDSRLVETHTAYLLLLADRVYKWKKPVDLGFVDFRTLDARRRACAAELALNRRLAPDVYLDVDVLVDGAGSPVEHVLVMRRLPDAARLSALVTGGDDVRDQVRRVARLVADLHSRCEPASEPRRVAGVDRLRELWDIGLDALSGGPAEVIGDSDVAQARQLVATFLDGRSALLEERITRGFVRDGHGDLLADDIFCLPDGPRILDCLDFDPTLRYGDVLSDVATLAMDLERLGAAQLGEQLLTDYAESSGERHPDSLAHLYLGYRAQVRAKVALIRATQTHDTEVRQAQHAQVRTLLTLMLAHLRQTRVRLVLAGGLPGSGKSTVAEGLSARMGALLHSSDLVRRELRLPAQERYSPAHVEQVYGILLDRAAAGLARGWDVVLDATWKNATHREAARRLARETCSALVELECDAPAALAEARLAERQAGHVSDADAVVRRRIARTADRWPEAVRIDTSGPMEEAVQSAYDATCRSTCPEA